MVRCRQKCTNSFPVPHGYTECTGSYEDDTCTVHCDDDYKLQGDSKIFCKGGVWENQDAKPASGQCKDIGVCQLICHEHSKFINRSHNGVPNQGNGGYVGVTENSILRGLNRSYHVDVLFCRKKFALTTGHVNENDLYHIQNILKNPLLSLSPLK